MKTVSEQLLDTLRAAHQRSRQGYSITDELARAVAEAEALLAAPELGTCDGNHGGPRCADPECWNDSPDAPPETIETAIQARKAAQEQLYAARERHAEEVKRLQAENGRLQSLTAEVSDATINRIVYEHTKLNPNQADDVELLTYIRKAIRAILALRPHAAPDELSPDFTDTARAALLWVLWHHQGGSSPVGQPIRYALGMGAHEHLNSHQVSEARRWATITGSMTSDFHACPQAVPMTGTQRMRLWQNTEKGKSATSFAAFERIVKIVEAAHRITAPGAQDGEGA